MTLTVRTACATDDLTRVWPSLGLRKLNLEQVIVAVDADDDDALLGAVLMYDAGHEVMYVGELTLVPGIPQRRYVAKKLVNDLLIWAHRRGATLLTFTCLDNDFAAQAMKLGAKIVGTPVMLALPLAGGAR